MTKNNRMRVICFSFIVFILLTSFQNAREEIYSFRVQHRILDFYENPYRCYTIIIEREEDFPHMSAIPMITLSSKNVQINAFQIYIRQKADMPFSKPDSTSRMIGCFTTDAFDTFKNEKVTLSYGYGVPTTIVAEDLEIFKIIKPLDPVLANIKAPELTKKILDSLRNKDK